MMVSLQKKETKFGGKNGDYQAKSKQIIQGFTITYLLWTP